MLNFKTLEELQSNEELRYMGRYCWKKVKLNEKEVFACTTNQQYEDIIWSETHEMLKHLFEHFNIDDKDDVSYDYASRIRDYVLELLEANGVEFVDVFDEY